MKNTRNLLYSKAIQTPFMVLKNLAPEEGPRLWPKRLPIEILWSLPPKRLEKNELTSCQFNHHRFITVGQYKNRKHVPEHVLQLL